MKHILTLSLCFLALSLSAQVGCIDFNACNYDSNANNNCEVEIETFDNFIYMGSLNGSSYYLYQNTSTWNSAQQMCQSLGGYLVTISSTEENNLVKSYIPSWSYPGSPQIWIGYALVNGVWEWVNGEANVYENFASGEPSGGSETIGLMWQNGTWNDGLFNSGAQISFLMERNCCDYPDFGEICQIQGCLDNTASNFNPNASEDDGSCVYTGCLDSSACNFNENATDDDGSCDYSCCPGPGCCNIGMTWNWELAICETSMPTDTNLDGCTDLNDLMDLLAAYGTCTSALPDFVTCGDLIEHEGYSYSTVQIGEQCWFAENCRYLPEVSDPSIDTTTEPHYSVYGYECTDVTAAQATTNYATYGVLYNWPAVMTEGICPSGWHIPSDGEWQTMEISLGLSESEAAGTGWRGTDEGYQMKSSSGWNDYNVSSGNGSNSSGWTGLPGGYRYSGGFNVNGDNGNWWSASESGSNSWKRKLNNNNDNVNRNNNNRNNGFSARCVRDRIKSKPQQTVGAFYYKTCN